MSWAQQMLNCAVHQLQFCSLLPSAERLADSMGTTITSNGRENGPDATNVTSTPPDSSLPT